MKLVFASNNKNKIAEIKKLLPNTIQLLSLADIGCHEDIAETANTIEGNAQLKANYVKKHYHYNCFADDTGLEVEALNGAPGVFSARYAGEHKNDTDNIKKLLLNLSETKNRKAQFKTVISLCLDNQEFNFTGICKGEITTQPAGIKGFGYDPIFTPEGYQETFAEMPQDEKNKISHRGKALQKLLAFLENKS